MVEEELSVADIEERNANDAEARKIREDAIAYAERVAAGEEPWNDQEADVNDFEEEDEAQPEPKNEDVGEVGEEGDEIVEVDQDNPAPEPTE